MIENIAPQPKTLTLKKDLANQKVVELKATLREYRNDIEGEVANQDVHLPIILPKLPGRFYFYFGKPIETEGNS